MPHFVLLCWREISSHWYIVDIHNFWAKDEDEAWLRASEATEGEQFGWLELCRSLARAIPSIELSVEPEGEESAW